MSMNESLQQIKAEAWDEGFSRGEVLGMNTQVHKSIGHGNGSYAENRERLIAAYVSSGKALSFTNPYRSEPTA